MSLTNFANLSAFTNYNPASAVFNNRICYISDDTARMVYVNNETAPGPSIFVANVPASTVTALALPPGTFELWQVRQCNADYLSVVGTLTGSTVAYSYSFATSAWSRVRGVSATALDYVFFDPTGEYCGSYNNDDSMLYIIDVPNQRTLTTSISSWDSWNNQITSNNVVVFNSDTTTTTIWTLSGTKVASLATTPGASAIASFDYYTCRNDDYVATTTWDGVNSLYGATIWVAATGAIKHYIPPQWDNVLPLHISADGNRFYYQAQVSATWYYRLYDFTTGTDMAVTTPLLPYGCGYPGTQTTGPLAVANSTLTTLALYSSRNNLGYTQVVGTRFGATFLRERLLGYY